MTAPVFLMLLSAFSVLTSLAVEAEKKVAADLKSNLAALITALVIGIAGTFAWYLFNGISFDIENIVYAILMGLAAALVAMVGYDKVKQALSQFIKSGE